MDNKSINLQVATRRTISAIYGILQIHTGNEYSKKWSRIQLWTRVAVNLEIYRKTISRARTRVIANKTGIERGPEKPGRDTRGTLLRCPESERELDRCIIHKTRHSLDDCRGFRSKSIDERKELLKQNNICYKCCASNKHRSGNVRKQSHARIAEVNNTRPPCM